MAGFQVWVGTKTNPEANDFFVDAKDADDAEDQARTILKDMPGMSLTRIEPVVNEQEA